MRLAKEESHQFLEGKVVADFGCGPRGSLCWATSARCRIGIDVLADSYMEFDISEQNMVYVASSEKKIPLPTNYLDIMFTMNALDHTSFIGLMCSEIVRVIKPGGTFIGSFNLAERGTFSEPQTLYEDKLESSLLHRFIPVHREFEDKGTSKLVFRGIKN